jgi:hypothetical protein
MTTHIEAFRQFLINTISGQESGLFKMKHLLSVDIKDVKMKMLLQRTMMEYLNSAYRSLILKSDTYILNSFDAMKKEKSHSDICLLNMQMQLILNAIMAINRTNFNVSSYEEYMQSMVDSYEKYFDTVDFDKLLNHECNGIDISTCDPNEPLFFVRINS